MYEMVFKRTNKATDSLLEINEGEGIDVDSENEASHVMHKCFLANYYLEQQRGDLAAKELGYLVTIFPGSQYIAVQVIKSHLSILIS
jgi:hypothetical protein